MPAPRIDLGELSPITQRIASSTFDLPQPLGPTMPVSPSSTRNSAGSTKLLKPESLSRLTFTWFYRAPVIRSSAGQHRLEPGPGHGSDRAAVDEEGRRALDSQIIAPAADRGEPVDSGAVGEAGMDLRRGQAARAEERIE